MVKLNRQTACRLGAWTFSLVVASLAFISWGEDNAWQLTQLSTYQVFPLLGLLAFSIMWSHYASSIWRQLLGLDLDVLQTYFRLTSYVVLVLLLLHPGLLIYQRFVDGFGLPPGSYKSYVAPQLAWLTLLGTAALLAFLAYELHRWYKDRRWWPVVVAIGDLAMLAIFYHGLRLGGQLSQNDWYLTVWWFYGLSLVVMLGRKYYLLLTTRTEHTSRID